jgi:ubiquitin C-terminal hydrolase
MDNFGAQEEMVQTFVVEELCPGAVKALLGRGEEWDEECFEQYNVFFQKYLSFCKTTAIDYDCVPTIETLGTLFDDKSKFYVNGGLQQVSEDGADGEFVTTETAPADLPQLLININYFGGCGGFESLFRRLEDLGGSRPRLDIVHWLAYVIQKVIHWLVPAVKRDFGVRLRDAVVRLLDSSTPEMLQHEDRKGIEGILVQLEHALRAAIGPQYRRDFEMFQLNLGRRLLRVHLLDKRLLGLQLISQIADNAREAMKRKALGDHEKHGDHWIPVPVLGEWMVREGLLEYLYGDGVQAELLARCAATVPGLLAEVGLLTEAHVDMIWKAAIGQHESILTEVYKAFPVIAGYVARPPLLMYMYRELTAVPLASYDTHFLGLVRDFTFQAAARMETLNDLAFDRSWFGLELLWQYTQDNSGAASAELEQVAGSMLANFFAYPVFQSQRPVFMERCVKQIEQGVCVPQAQTLLISIIMTYPAGSEENHISSVIQWLENRYNMLELVVQDMVRYQAIAKAKAAALPREADPNICVFRGSRPHHVNVTQRKNLLSYVLVRASIELSVQQLDMCWDCMVVNAVGDWERSMAFAWWLESVKPLTAADEKEGIVNPLFKDDAARHIFDKFQSLQPEAFTDGAFKCFRGFFNRCNTNARLLMVQGENRYLVHSANLLGIETLWRVAISATWDQVAQEAAKLLVLLQKNVSDGIAKGHLAQFRHAFVGQCMTQLQGAVDAADHAKVSRCIRVLETFLSELRGRTVDVNAESFKIKVTLVGNQKHALEVDVFPHTTIGEVSVRISKELDNVDPRLLRLISAGAEFKFDSDTVSECKIAPNSTIHCVVRQEVPIGKRNAATGPYVAPSLLSTDPELAPGAILNSPAYFDRLFALLDLPRDVAEVVFVLLAKLPFNPAMTERLVALEPIPVDWDAMLPTSSLCKLYYTMRVVEGIALNGTTPNHTWLDLFHARGGLKYLGQIFASRDWVPRGASFGVESLTLLLKVVVAHCVDAERGVLKDSANDFLPRQPLLQRVLQLLETLAKSPSKPSSGAAAQLLCEVLVPLVASTPDALQVMFGDAAFLDWLGQVILVSAVPGVRSSVCDALFQIASKEASVAGRLLENLLVLLERAESYQETCWHFFTLCDKMVDKVVASNPVAFEKLTRGLCQRVFARPTVERHALSEKEGEADYVLQGYMQLLSTLLEHNLPLAVALGSGETGMLAYLFRACLFETPTLQDHGPLSPPKCKTRSTRNVALNLLKVFAKANEDLYHVLTDQLMQHHVLGETRSNWQYLPSAMEKDACGYVGLKNLGATCYMNSFTQNLYMHPGFRKAIFESDPMANGGPQDVEKNVLYQLQSFFGHLQESDLRYYNTRPFVEAYPLSPVTQQDVDEFMNLCFDRIDTLVKGTATANLPGRFFGGSLMNQIISKECPHLSEREEQFMAVSLEVKGKRNLSEALLGYIQGDLLSGENKYECSQCNKKVDAVKRVCLNRLPDTLMVSLKRFAFNYETFVREKVNSHFDFPHEIDLWEFSRKGLAKSEGKTLVDEEGKFNAPDDRDYYKYRLVGIVVHTGTTDMGHYYAFVKERVPLAQGPTAEQSGGRWISFNDSSVEEYDANQIPADCFGGLSDVVRLDPKTNQPLPPEEKAYSAYMLLYERVGMQHDPQYSATAQHNVPRKVLEQVWASNASFAMDKGVYHEDYFTFLWGLIRQHQNAAPVGDVALAGYDPVFQAIRLGTKFLFETLCRAKQKHHLQQWSLELAEMYRKHIPACRWFLSRITASSTWIENVFFYCPSKSVREIMADLIVAVMGFVSAEPSEPASYSLHDQGPLSEEFIAREARLPKVDTSKIEMYFADKNPSFTLVTRFVDSLLVLFDASRSHWRLLGEFWKLLEGFVKLGPRERAFFNSRRGGPMMIDCYLGDASPVAKSYPGKEARKRWTAKNAHPDLSHFVATIASLVCSCHTLHPRSLNLAEELDKTLGNFVVNVTFWKWAMEDGTCAEELCHLIEWLTWDTQPFSTVILDQATTVVNDSETADLDPSFVVLKKALAIPDSLAEWRATHFVGPFLRMVEANAKYRVFVLKCIEFLVQTSAAVPTVREELFRGRARWLKKYLLFDSRAVRVETEKLFKTLTGEPEAAQAAEEFAVATGAGGMVDPVINVRCTDLMLSLYDFMPSLHELLKVDKKTINTQDAKVYMEMWMVNSYFKCLLWCVRSMSQVEKFIAGFESFRALYLALEVTRNEADLNRKELIRFWHKCFGRRVTPDAPFNAYPFSVRDMMLKDEALCMRFIDFFVSLRSSTRYIEYNNTSLVPFYEMLTSMLEEPAFVALMAGHRNYDWSVQFLWLETAAYPNIAPLIKNVVKILCESGSQYRQRHLQWVVTLPLMDLHWSRVLFYLDWLVADQADSVVFCRANGLEYLARFFANLPLMLQKNVTTVAKVEPFVARALRVFQRSIKWMSLEIDGHAKEMRQAALEQWENKLDTVHKLLHVGVTFGKPEVTSNVYCCLQVMAQVDRGCRSTLLKAMYDFHLMFREQGVARLPHHMAMASPHQSEHTLNLNKLHEYYVFVREVVTALLDDAQTAAVERDDLAHACGLCLTVVMECPLTLGHLCDSFLVLLEKFPDQQVVAQNKLYGQMFRHFLSEGAAPKLTSPGTLRFVRDGFGRFADQLSGEEVAALSGWCAGTIVSWLAADAGATSVALALLSVCLRDARFAAPLLANPVIEEALQKDPAGRPQENKALWTSVRDEWKKAKGL